MGKLASKLTKRIMAVALSTAMILSNMTVYASELSGPVQQTEEAVENTETDAAELPATEDETADDEITQDDGTQDETTSGEDSSEAQDDAEGGDVSTPEETDEEVSETGDEAAPEEELGAAEASEIIDESTALEDKSGNPTIWLVGDSTVCSFTDPYYYPRYGYGTKIGDYLDGTYTIKNLAASGRSSKSYLTESADKYKELKDGLGEGDILIIGFGHNDEKTGDTTYTSPTGNYLTDKDSFAYSLYENYIKVADAAGAKTILCTPIVRRTTGESFSDSQLHVANGGSYPEAIIQLGAAVNVPVVDLTTLTKELYLEVGAAETLKYHAWTNSKAASVDNTHLNEYGAKIVAHLFAEEVQKRDIHGLASHIDINDNNKPNEERDWKPNPTYEEPTYTPPTTGSTNWKPYKIGDVEFEGTIFGANAKKDNTTLETDDDGNMHIAVTNNQGKIQSTDDSIAMYYYKVPAGKLFKLSAKATIKSFDLSSNPNQSAFGLMARDTMYIDYTGSGNTVNTDYVVAGSLGGGTNCFKRQNGTLSSGSGLTKESIEKGNSYDLSIIYNGDGFECTFGDEPTPVGGYDFPLTQVDGESVYVGMFVARNMDVVFNNIYLEIDGNIIADNRRIEYAVNVTTDGNGTASANKNSAASGETVTLTARPNYGYEFDKWEVLSGGVTVDENNTFTMLSSDVSVKAIFKERVGKTIDVWDFGALAESDTSIYSNNITPDNIKEYIIAPDKVTTEIKQGMYQGTPPAVFGDLSMFYVAKDRLYTTIGALSGYNYGTYSHATTNAYKDIDGYEPAGAWYGNGAGSTTQRYVLIENVQAGDKIIAYMGNHHTEGTGTYTFVGQGDASAQTETVSAGAGEFNKFEFVARYTGTYKLYQSNSEGKIMYHRIMRIPAVTVKGTIDFNDNKLPSGYSVNFVNQTTKSESVATVSDDGTFTVSLAAGYTYTVALSGATGFGFTVESSTLTTTDEEAITGKNGVTLVVEPKTLYRFSGTIKGFDAGYKKLDNLAIAMVPAQSSGLAEVELDIVNTGDKLTFSKELEPDVEYTLDLRGVNDYEIISPLVVNKNKENEGTSYENRTITVALRPKYDVVGGFMGLGSGVTVTSLNFTNVNDNYTYTAQVEGSEYSVSLRDGEYLAKAVVSDADYTTSTHVVVNGGAISKDLMFVSSKAKGSLEKKKDIYVGYPEEEDNYNTVTEAVEACSLMNPTKEEERITVHIAPGTYREQVRINTPYISFVNGTDDEVLLTWYYGIGYTYYSAGDDGYYDAEKAYDKYSKNKVERWGAAVRIESNAVAFRAEGITFENSFNRYVTKEEVADGVEANPSKYTDTKITASRNVGDDVTSKALTERAAAIAVEADQAEFLNCGFYSSQDTLYTNNGIHAYFKNCVIEGQTDYIFGSGNSVFDACELSWKGYSAKGENGYVTANKSPNTEKGYLFRNCTITANNYNKLQVVGGYFGRPWSDDAPTIFINTKLQNEDLILAAGWADMSTRKAINAKFGEYNTTTISGEAVSTSGRVDGKTMNEETANAIKVTDYFGEGWTPAYYTAEDDNVSFEKNPTIQTNGDANTPYPGNTLTAAYSLGEKNDENDASLIQWYRVDDNSNTTLVKTSNATISKKYKITAADVGSKIKVVVTPATVSGNTGIAQESELTAEIREGYEDPDNAGGDAVLGDGVNVFLVGDSTVKDYSASGLNSSGSARDEGAWGEFLQSYFNEEEVTVINYANGGRSTRNFINEGSLDKVAKLIGDGDYLFIQFGHNDAADDTNNKADRYVPLGDPVDGKYPSTPGEKVSTPAELASKGYGDTCYTWDTSGGTFKWYLQQYINVALNAGAIPVLVTPVSRMYYDANGNIRAHHDASSLAQELKTNSYVTAVKELAEENKEKGVLLIDGFDLTKNLFESAYKECGSSVNGTQIMYAGDSTHNNKLGGMIEAAAIASAIQDKEINISYAIKAPTNVRGATTTGKTVFTVDENSSLTAFDINSNYEEHATYWEGVGQNMINAIKVKADELSTKGTNGALNAPKASPDPANKVDAGQEVTLTVTGAEPDTYKIIYTLDGTNPKSTKEEDEDSIKEYSDSNKITINSNTTIKTYAKAINQESVSENKLTDSKVATYVYTLAPAVKAPTAPAQYPSGSVVDAGTKIKLETATSEAEIRYTMGTNPADPTIHSPLQKSEGITVNTDTTIKAIAVKDNNISDVATFTYKVSADASGGTLSDPIFDPDEGGEVALNSEVKLSSADGARIYYIYGSNPADPEPGYADIYDEPIIVNKNMTIKAIAVKGKASSNVVSRSYTVPTVEVPEPSEEPGEVPIGTPITLVSKTEEATIWYTVDRSDPRFSETRTEFTEAIVINDDTTIKAYAVKEGLADSDVVTLKYTVPTTTKPDASPAPGEVEKGTKVTLTSEPGATIYYTLDGSSPKNNDAKLKYENPIVINGDTTIQAYAELSGKVDSAVVTFTYTVKGSTGSDGPTNNEGFKITLNKDSYTYTGSAIIPDADDYEVTYNGMTLIEGIDYTVKYSNNIKVSSGSSKAKMTVTGKGNLSGSTFETFTIVQKSLDINDNTGLGAVQGNVIYVAKGSKATPVLSYGGIKLTTKDFDITNGKDTKWNDSKEEGITIKGKGNFIGERKLDVKVLEKDAQKNAKITVKLDSAKNKNLTYKGEGEENKVEPVFEVTTKSGLSSNASGEKALKEAKDGEDGDYIVSYPEDMNSAGKKTFTIIGISERCVGTVTKSYTVKPAPKSDTAVKVTMDGDEIKASTSLTFVSTGSTFTQEEHELEVTYDGTPLVEGKDYKITYSGNKKVGDKAKYTITGLGNYKGVKKSGTFKITEADIAEAVDIIVADVVFSKPKSFKFKPFVIENESNTVLKSSYYTVKYLDDNGKELTEVKENDKVWVTITGKGGYKGTSEPVSYTVKKGTKDLSKAKIAFYEEGVSKATSKFSYTGGEIKPAKIEIIFNDKSKVSLTLDENGKYTNDDYDVTLVNNVNKGKATVIIKYNTDEANVYVGGKSATFSINAKSIKK